MSASNGDMRRYLPEWALIVAALLITCSPALTGKLLEAIRHLETALGRRPDLAPARKLLAELRRRSSP